jgi:hypothetical protein
MELRPGLKDVRRPVMSAARPGRRSACWLVRGRCVLIPVAQAERLISAAHRLRLRGCLRPGHRELLVPGCGRVDRLLPARPRHRRRRPGRHGWAEAGARAGSGPAWSRRHAARQARASTGRSRRAAWICSLAGGPAQRAGSPAGAAPGLSARGSGAAVAAASACRPGIRGVFSPARVARRPSASPARGQSGAGPAAARAEGQDVAGGAARRWRVRAGAGAPGSGSGCGGRPCA